MRYIVGIDEVGRGPLAGPVTVGIVMCRTHFSIDGMTDSKVMTEKARKRIAERAMELKGRGLVRWGIFSSSASMIDREGIERAIASAIARGLRIIAPDPRSVEVVLDGRLRAPKEYHQQTIIRGDVIVPAISLAAILAKISRDRYMIATADKKYPVYGFNEHKGYGTALHMRALREHGPSPIHRRSFLRGILDVSIA